MRAQPLGYNVSMQAESGIQPTEMTHNAKLAQFGAIVRYLLCSETLTETGQRALELIAEKCDHQNLNDRISSDEFDRCGLASHLQFWEKLGYNSEDEFKKSYGLDKPVVLDNELSQA